MDYDTWKTGYFECDQDRTLCTECTDIQQKFDQAVEFLESVRDQLYGKETFNRELFNFRFAELCWLLNVSEPKEKLTVFSLNAKENKLFNFTLHIAKDLSPKIQPKIINF